MAKNRFLFRRKQKSRSSKPLGYSFKKRLNLLLGLCLIMLGLLGFQLYRLQVLQYHQYTAESNQNRISILPSIPSRGLIYDRHGHLLAVNKRIYQLAINANVERHIAYQQITQLSQILVFNVRQAKETFLNNHRQRTSVEKIPFLNVTEKQLAQFANISFLYPHISIHYDYQRYYPYGAHAVHILGHVGAINHAELYDESLFERPKDGKNYRLIGKNGIERAYDRELRGKIGFEVIETNARGQRVRTLETQPSLKGQDLFLTIDIRLQQYLDELMQDKQGAIVAMNPNNGEILAATSAPFFDNNLRINPSVHTYRSLNQDLNRPLLNRFAHGLYPPASLFKPFVALAALEILNLNPEQKIFATDYYQIEEDKRLFYDWKRGGHGWVDLNQAIAVSSDVYFYQLAHRMGIEAMHTYLKHFPFGQKTDIDLFGESIGILPNNDWKLNRFGDPWLTGESLIFAIGQGYLLATPLQLTLAVASIANQGKRIKPKLKQSMHWDEINPQKLPIYNAQNWQIIHQALINTLHQPYGTAYQVGQSATYTLAGKTGTAQVVGLSQNIDSRQEEVENLDKKLQDHALFAAYAPAENPQIVVVVVVENGGSGSRVAAPIAKSVIDRYFALN